MKKHLFLFMLMNSAFAIYSMEQENEFSQEKKSSHTAQEELVSEKHTEKKAINPFQGDPLSLKLSCIKQIYHQMASPKFDENSLAQLPTELRENFALYEKIDSLYLSLKNKTERKVPSEIIENVRLLLIQLLNIDPWHKQLCIEAIQQFLYLNEQKQLSDESLKLRVKIIYIILKITLNPDKIYSIISNLVSGNKPSQKEVNTLIFDFIMLLVRENAICLMKLVLHLNILPDGVIQCILCCLCYLKDNCEMIMIVLDNINHRKTYKFLIKNHILYSLMDKNLAAVKLFFEKMEHYGFNIKKILNDDRDEKWGSLLNKAISLNMLDMVELLLSKGADPSRQNAVSVALSRYEEMISLSKLNTQENHQDKVATSKKILELITEALLINKDTVNYTT